MKIAVCCSSSDDIDKRYLGSSKKLLEQIFKRDNDLVFGAMNNGIMGIAYRTAKQYNRNVTGIAPEIYKDDFKQLDCDTEFTSPKVRTSYNVANDYMTVMDLLGKINLAKREECIER